MEIKYDIATKDDINELIRLRIAYMMDDFGSVSEDERIALEKQLPDYFLRKLGSELIAFVARDENRIVSVAYLLIIDTTKIIIARGKLNRLFLKKTNILGIIQLTKEL